MSALLKFSSTCIYQVSSLRLQRSKVCSLTRQGHIIRFLSQASGMGKSALVILAEGAEEMEAVISIDVLRRGAFDVVVGGLAGPDIVKCSRGVFVKPDTSLKDAISGNKEYDVIVLPGGLGGAKLLGESTDVKDLLLKQEKQGKFIAAICAGPTALLSHGICLGKSLTSHPSVKDKLEGKYRYSEERVVQDGQLITSRGPGTAFEFALRVVEAVDSKENADKLVAPMLVKV